MNPLVVIDVIVPIVKIMINDASEHVRIAMAGSIMGLAPVLGKERTIEHLLPLF